MNITIKILISLLLFHFLFNSLLFAQNEPFKIAIKGEPNSLDPHRKKVVWDQFVAKAIFDTLTHYSKNNVANTSLIEDWSNLDSLTWEIKIRQDVVFHNGDPLTTEDIIFSFNRIKTKYKAYLGAFSNIDSYSIIDKFTFLIKTSKPFDSFYDAFNNIYIVPKKYILRVGDEEFARHPIGSGKYMFKEGNTKNISLLRNPKYWGNAPYIDEVIIKQVPRSQQFNALLEGKVDLVQNLLSDEFKELSKNPDFKVYSGHSNSFHYLGFDTRTRKPPKVNLDENPFTNHKVRLAIAKTIDLSIINKEVFSDKAYLISQLADSGVFGFNDKIKIHKNNIEEAKKLMKEAGYEDGFTVTLNTPLGSREDVAKQIAIGLKSINIKVNVEPIVDKLFWKELFKEVHGFSMFLGGFSVGQSVEHSLNSLFATRSTKGQGRLNFFGYSNLSVDKLLVDAKNSLETKKKLQLLQNANQTIMKDIPIIPLYSTPKLYGLSKNIDWKPKFATSIKIENVKYVKEKSIYDKLKKLFE